MTMAPQMRQSLKMLQMPVLELRTELLNQMRDNPVIEDVTSPTERALSSVAPDEHNNDSPADKPLDFDPDNAAAVDSILRADDGYRDYFMGNMESASGDEEADSRRQHLFDSQTKPETLQDHLLEQLPLSGLNDADRELATILIGNINEDGYFTGSLPDIEMVTGLKEDHVLTVLARVRQFDPVGCGSRDLRECLLSQMEKLDDSPWEDEVRALISDHLEDIAAHRERVLCAALKLTPDEYAKALAELRTLEPRPGRAFSAERTEYVKPEISLVQKGGRLIAVVDSRDLPVIHVSQRYRTMLEDPNVDAATKSYIRERIRAAMALVESVEKRQETIRRIAQEIVDAQPDYFEKGVSGLRPLTMLEIAKKVGVHETTVSRTVRDKYMRTPRGVVELRKFFTAGLPTDSGEAVSNRSIQEKLRQILEGEDRTKPYSDEKLAEMLRAQGVDIARRTVAKYRLILRIPGAIERRVKA